MAIHIRRRQFIVTLSSAAAWPLSALAQQTERVRRIGVLMRLPEHDEGTKARLAGLQLGLGRLGWFTGRNIQIDYRFAGLSAEVGPRAKELVALQPDVILCMGSPPTYALQQEIQTIPIVFVGVADPIGSGFVTSLARPGGNITGFLLFEASITGKWLAMLKEIAPNLTRAALVINPKTAPYYEFYLGPAHIAASSLGVELVLTPIDDVPDDIDRAFDAFARVPNGGLLLPPDINSTTHLDLIIALAARHRLPAVYSDRLFVSAGGLICYGTDRADQFRTAAAYVDRILRGAKPADLPVQVPSRYETVVNIKTANALGLTLPPALLVAADEVIE
jgi:putative ABC transport system substrate-binding protein